LRLFSFGGYGLALAALAFMVFGAIECPPNIPNCIPRFVGKPTGVSAERGTNITKKMTVA